MTDKPTASEGLGRTWGETAALLVDPDSILAGKVSSGWLVEKPPVEYMNWVQRFVTKFINHINEEGIPSWDAGTTYPEFAVVKGGDGNLYRSNQITTGDDPTTEPEWGLLNAGDFLADGSVPMTGNFNANNNQLTNLPAPINDDHAANMYYVDHAHVSKSGSSGGNYWTVTGGILEWFGQHNVTSSLEQLVIFAGASSTLAIPRFSATATMFSFTGDADTSSTNTHASAPNNPASVNVRGVLGDPLNWTVKGPVDPAWLALLV